MSVSSSPAAALRRSLFGPPLPHVIAHVVALAFAAFGPFGRMFVSIARGHAMQPLLTHSVTRHVFLPDVVKRKSA